MKIPIRTLTGEEKGTKTLPREFSEPLRFDLIKRAVLALQAMSRQPYGSDPEAGKKASAELSRRRKKYRGSYGFGISRVPRKILSRRGTRFNWVGAFAPGTVKGRRAHPPKAEKNWEQKLNTKERQKAIRSALAATLNAELVKERGHKIPDNYPFILSTDAEALKNTKAVRDALAALGFADELTRAANKTIRSGRGKTRGRRYRKPTSLLVVVSEDCALTKAARNMPGMDVVAVNHINAELLAPGCVPGRATLYTEKAIDEMGGKK